MARPNQFTFNLGTYPPVDECHRQLMRVASSRRPMGHRPIVQKPGRSDDLQAPMVRNSCSPLNANCSVLATKSGEHHLSTKRADDRCSQFQQCFVDSQVGPRFLARRGLGAEEPSMLPRIHSIWSCSRKRVSMAWGNCSQTPAAFQSRRRLQHVMPLS